MTGDPSIQSSVGAKEAFSLDWTIEALKRENKKLREVHDIFTVGTTGIDTSGKVDVFRPLVFLTVPESTVPEWNTEEDKEKYKQALETENEKLRQVSD